MTRVCNGCGSSSTYVNKKSKEVWYRDKWSGKGFLCNSCGLKARHTDNKDKYNEPKNKKYRENINGYKDQQDERSKKRREDKPDERKIYYKNNKSQEAENHRVWVSNNVQACIARNQRFLENNPDYFTEYNRKHYKENKLRTANRRARLRQAMPPWVDLEVIAKIYNECPAGYQVDHIHPVQGKNASGLHVPWNFQYLKAIENGFKGRRHDGTYENEGWRKKYAVYERAKSMLAKEREGSELTSRPEGDGVDRTSELED